MLKEIVQFDRCTYNPYDRALFRDVVFLRDFGPWKKGEKVSELKVDFFSGEMTGFLYSSYSSTKRMQFRLFPESPMADLAELVAEAG